MPISLSASSCSPALAEGSAPGRPGGRARRRRGRCERRDDGGDVQPAMRAIASCPVPTVARVNGVAAGGGSVWRCHATSRSRRRPRSSCRPLVHDSASFPTLAPRITCGARWCRTCARHRDAGRSDHRGAGRRLGLIWQAVDDDELDAAVDAVTATLKRSSPTAMTRIRSTLAQAARNTLSEHLDLELHHQRDLIPLNLAEARLLSSRSVTRTSARRADGPCWCGNDQLTDFLARMRQLFDECAALDASDGVRFRLLVAASRCLTD